MFIPDVCFRNDYMRRINMKRDDLPHEDLCVWHIVEVEQNASDINSK